MRSCGFVEDVAKVPSQHLVRIAHLRAPLVLSNLAWLFASISNDADDES